MKYAQFIQALSENAETDLVFEFGNQEIRPDYHITEVFNVSVEAIDCGGAVDTWKEIVLQLIEPSRSNGERHMSAKKALGILEKSGQKIALSDTGSVILEFKPDGSIAAQRYAVDHIAVVDERIVVTAAGSTTQCKAASRSNDKDSCCGTSSQPSKSACCA